MNACATSVLEEFPDVVFSYGVSDEYRYLPHGTFHLLNLIIFFCFPLQLEIILRGFPFFSFIFKNTTDVHSRRSRYVLSTLLIFLTVWSTYLIDLSLQQNYITCSISLLFNVRFEVERVFPYEKVEISTFF